MSRLSILIVEDEAAQRDLLGGFLEDEGHRIRAVGTVSEAEDALAGGAFDVVVCDVRLPDGDGIEFLRETRLKGHKVLFIMMTAFGSVELVVESLRADAFDFITKPVRRQELVHRLSRAGSMLSLQAENSALRAAARKAADDFYHFTSPPMVALERLINKVAPMEHTVLLCGESGTGKGIVARQIHDRSAHRGGPFVAVNCSAIPENLIESELFGHIKGSFTGAERERKGLFVQANHGTLFLDEIGELPVAMQAKLLHVLEDKAVRPIGSESPRQVMVRIVAATNRDLPEMVGAGTFREDLFFRIATFQLDLPPLHDRQGDLPGLIDHILARVTRDSSSGLGKFLLDRDAKLALLAYDWPGNVRELENALTRSIIVADGEQITLADLPPDIANAVDSVEVSGGARSPDGLTLRERVRHYEAEVIREAVSGAGGGRKLAAVRLGIGVSSLYRKLEESSPSGRGEPDD